jgi:succinate-acetate transporter protein
VVVGMALFVGGLAQLLAGTSALPPIDGVIVSNACFVIGMWEFACGNTFGATGELIIPYPGSVLLFSKTSCGPVCTGP